MPISDAINYLVNDSSLVLKKPMPEERHLYRKRKGILYKINFRGTGHVDAFDYIQTALNNGNLMAWGSRELPNKSFENSLRPIPTAYWQDAGMNYWFCFNKHSQNPQTIALPKKSTEVYSRLTLNKQQVISLWTKGPLWRIILMNLRILKRENYHGNALDRHYNIIEKNIYK